ncbi:Conserved_hypothetical protein [Hexamita inflata]|uniref:Uncharacterized protein n=1 Tax=Hexamita inflata TaxID=28002 RepID=A0AA86NSH1_9EUKA|nr:Conserved hypothetical protein [Hexamita inflata]
MSYSTLRVFAQQTNFKRLHVKHQEEQQVQQSFRISQLQSEQAQMLFKDNYPAFLQNQVNDIFNDALELNTEQSLNNKFVSDSQKWQRLQEQLAQPLKSVQQQQFFAQLVQIFQQASEHEIGYSKSRLEFVQNQVQDLLRRDPVYLYLSLIIDFKQSNMSGVKYLTNYFSKQNLQAALDQTSMVTTQTGYSYCQAQSRFEQVLYSFLKGEVIRNDPNFSNREQNIIMNLNKLTTSNYDFSQITPLSDDNTSMVHSRSALDSSKDQYYHILNDFMLSKPVNAPFIIQTFFQLINPVAELTNTTSFSQKNQNIKLFLKALNNDFTSLFQDLQYFGLSIEFLILSLFSQKELKEFYLQKTINEVETSLLEDILNNTLLQSQSHSVMVLNQFAAAVHLLKNNVVDLKPWSFNVFDREFSVIFDVIAAQIQYLQLKEGRMISLKSENQKYILGIMYYVKLEFTLAFEILMSLKTKFEYLDDYLTQLAQQLTMQILFNPTNAFQLQDQLQLLDIENEYQNTQVQICLTLIELAKAYHSNQINTIKQNLTKLQLSKLDVLGQVFIDKFTVLAKFLILCSIKSKSCQNEIRIFVGKYEIDAECKKLMIGL